MLLLSLHIHSGDDSDLWAKKRQSINYHRYAISPTFVSGLHLDASSDFLGMRHSRGCLVVLLLKNCMRKLSAPFFSSSIGESMG